LLIGTFIYVGPVFQRFLSTNISIYTTVGSGFKNTLRVELSVLRWAILLGIVKLHCIKQSKKKKKNKN
jgi:hypothetical protein